MQNLVVYSPYTRIIPSFIKYWIPWMKDPAEQKIIEKLAQTPTLLKIGIFLMTCFMELHKLEHIVWCKFQRQDHVCMQIHIL